jgi:hypothetical protein
MPPNPMFIYMSCDWRQRKLKWRLCSYEKIRSYFHHRYFMTNKSLAGAELVSLLFGIVIHWHFRNSKSHNLQRTSLIAQNNFAWLQTTQSCERSALLSINYVSNPMQIQHLPLRKYIKISKQLTRHKCLT